MNFLTQMCVFFETQEFEGWKFRGKNVENVNDMLGGGNSNVVVFSPLITWGRFPF